MRAGEAAVEKAPFGYVQASWVYAANGGAELQVPDGSHRVLLRRRRRARPATTRPPSVCRNNGWGSGAGIASGFVERMYMWSIIRPVGLASPRSRLVSFARMMSAPLVPAGKGAV